MNHIKFISVSMLSGLLLMLSACSGFLDVNDNPTKVSDASLNVLLPTVIEATSRSHYYHISSACLVTHQVDNFFGYYGNMTMDANWETGYLTSLNLLKTIVEKAEETGSPHYKGVARVLQALNIGLITDAWENAPLSEALTGSINTTPIYDSQEEMYNMIFSFLDEAVTLLETAESFESPGNDDLAYDGDLEKWTRLAHSLKARYLLHLTKKSPGNWNLILDEAGKGMSSSADNFQLIYNSVNLNPVHKNIALANQTGNFTYTYGKMFVDNLKGEYSGVVDPRLPLLVDKGENDEYQGLASYDDNAPAETVNISINTWYGKANSPILMMSYAELKFIEAEAQLNLGGDAQTPYQEGVESNMRMVEVNEEAIGAYVNEPGFVLNGTNDLSKIMMEKYIALIFNGESWNDMRRHNFNPNIFKGFVNVNRNNNPQVNRDGPAQRALYPTTEFSRNAKNAQENFKAIDVKMWKDN